VLVPWPGTKYTIRRRWWLPPSLGCDESCEFVFACDSSVHQRCSNYALTNLLFSLYRSVWMTRLSIFLIPPQSSSMPFYPQSVTNQGMRPNSFSFHYLFFFGLKTKSIKELRGASPNFSWDEGSQPYTFPNPFDYAQLKHFPLPILLVLIVGYDHYPNPPPFLQHTFNFHLKSCVPPMGVNLPVKGKFIISIPVKHIIHPIQTFMIILAQYLPLFPLH
jgi:hypothetical protein